MITSLLCATMESRHGALFYGTDCQLKLCLVVVKKGEHDPESLSFSLQPISINMSNFICKNTPMSPNYAAK